MTQGITVLGLGSGDENQLTLGVLRRLRQAPKLILRTDHHPVAAYLRAEGIRYETFDAIYEAKDRFDDTYEAIAASLLESARTQAVVYAVPGHPMVAEYTVQLLRAKCPDAGIPLEIVGGESFLDQAFLRFGFDPIEGMQLLDATDLRPGMLNPRLHTVIGQVYDTFTASDVKLTLMELYPDDYTVYAGHSLGVAGEETVVRIPLYELDRIEGYGNLSLVWVPRSDRDELRNRTLDRLHEIVAILRSPEGCPWDREQTHASLRKNLIEEAYEVLETIDEDDPDHMCEELGDLLLQVMLHSQMEEETGAFTVYDVIAGLNEKLIRRHPHVFGTEGAENAEEALANWQQMKDEEKRRKGIDPSKQSALAGVPKDLPALMKALKLQKKAAGVGFDWSEVGEVIGKITEELGEVQEAMENGAAAERLDELGDLLFAVVNLSRFLKVDPEEALASTNRKFVRRFQYIEERLEARGKSLTEADLAEMEELWQEAKKLQSTQGFQQDFPS